MKRIHSIFFMTAFFASAVVVSCQDDEQALTTVTDADSGEVRLALVAVGSSGNVYRLRNGVFDIWSFTTGDFFTVSTESYLDDDTIVLSLDPGDYEVYLNPGYRLEIVDSADTEGGDADAGLTNDEDVQAVLISANPVYTSVWSHATTDVNFTFRVGSDIVGPDGNLSLGITVEEFDNADCMDSFEPNDSLYNPSTVEIENLIEAVVCANDNDYYVFDAPAAEGETFAVQVFFSHQISDIDIALYDASGMIVSSSTSVQDWETVGAVSNGGSYILHVYPYNGGPANPYVVELVDTEPNDCCTVSPFAGCTDPEVEACVCEYASWCCEGSFDDFCVEIAIGECSAECAPGEGDCCAASTEPGCNDAAIQNCVCGIDSYCCLGEYDEFCVAAAVAECDLSCDLSEPDSDCCNEGASPGCTDPEIEACVCDIDPICCVSPFDHNCVGLSVDLCGADC